MQFKFITSPFKYPFYKGLPCNNVDLFCIYIMDIINTNLNGKKNKKKAIWIEVRD
jgi:hypothetical protein